MNVPRRRIIRPDRPPSAVSPMLRLLRERLEKEQTLLARWMTRLKRAFHAMEKQQRRVARLEKSLARSEACP